MLESEVERPVCKFAIKQGCFAMKLSGMNQRGQPDHQFLYKGKIIFIEFKRPGERPTALQSWWGKKLIAQGFKWFWCDDVEEGKKLIREHLLAA